MSKEEKKEKTIWDCPVCWEHEYYPLILACGHSICQHCLAQLQGDKFCPECRAEITFFTPNYIVGQALNLEYKDYVRPPPTTNTNTNTNSNTNSNTNTNRPNSDSNTNEALPDSFSHFLRNRTRVQFNIPNNLVSEDEWSLLEPYINSVIPNILRPYIHRNNVPLGRNETGNETRNESEVENVNTSRFPLTYRGPREYSWWVFGFICVIIFGLLFLIWNYVPKEAFSTFASIIIFTIFVGINLFLTH